MAPVPSAKRFSRCEHCFRAERDGGICPRCGFDGVARNQPPLLPEGTAVGGRYVLGREEGQGGFSICYRAWDGKEVIAVKELFPRAVARRRPDGFVHVDVRHREDFVTAAEAIDREADILRQLDQEPAIIQVRDVFPDNDTVYMAMEYLRGRPYDKYLQEQNARTGMQIDVATAVDVVLVILGALETVHERRLLHLDIKPPNIRVLDDARIVLLDFGSARDAFRAGNGAYGGTFTPGFAGPEQFKADGTVSPATDVHAVAAVLYYSLSLNVPERADNRERGAPLVPLSAFNPMVPPELDSVVEQALALEATARYASARLFKAALAPFGTLQVKPLARVASTGRRIVAGLLDILVALVLFALVGSLVELAVGPAILAGFALWWLLQLLPGVVGRTPGMFATGQRLVAADGRPLTFGAVALRATLLVPAVLVPQFRPGRPGTLLHDRASGTHPVRA